MLIVDQFDELLTETPEPARAPFIDFLLKLAAMRGRGGFRVVLTVRVDYFNLCRPYGALYSELQGSARVLRLKRISDAGLEEAVRAPLRMAGFSDESGTEGARRRDTPRSRRPPRRSRLAQMALWTVWRNRRAHGGSLLKAYVNVGGVSGALAQEAERVRTGSAAFSPEGARVVTASGDKTARLWDAATGKQVAVLRGHDDLVRSAAFSPDGSRVVTASEDKTARLWDVGAIPEATLFQIACTWLPRLDRCCTRLWRDQSSTDM